jgi:hypothetical protein
MTTTSTFRLVMSDHSTRRVTCPIDPDRATSHRVMIELQAYSETLFGDRLRVLSFETMTVRGEIR